MSRESNLFKHAWFLPMPMQLCLCWRWLSMHRYAHHLYIVLFLVILVSLSVELRITDNLFNVCRQNIIRTVDYFYLEKNWKVFSIKTTLHLDFS